jgi:phage FluMu gp28-like protein
MDNAQSYFLPYQLAWHEDKSHIKFWEKSRRIGATYTESYDDVEDCIYERIRQKNVWFSSADESAAKEYIDYCAMWARIYDAGARLLGEIVIDRDRDIKALSIEFANGYRINALTSNPKRFRSKGGKVVLDEFAHHEDQAAMWKAAKPSAMWGDQIVVMSTHQGKGLFYKMIQKIKEGKTKWSLHTTDIVQAAHAGIVSKILKHEASETEIQSWLKQEEEDCFDPIIWLEEYMCQAQDEGDAFIDFPLIAGCESEDVLYEQKILDEFWIGTGIHDPKSSESKWVHDKLDEFREWFYKIRPAGNFFLGVDIGRKKDLTAFWLGEQLLNVNICRSLLCMQNMPFWVQEKYLWILLKHPKLARCCIDSTGLGMQLAERAIDEHGESRIEAINFATGSIRTDMAFFTKKNFENKTLLIPANEVIRNDIHSMKKVTTAANNIRLEAETNAGITGHADRFWGLSLELHASAIDFGPVNVYSRSRRDSIRTLRGYDSIIADIEDY